MITPRMGVVSLLMIGIVLFPLVSCKTPSETRPEDGGAATRESAAQARLMPETPSPVAIQRQAEPAPPPDALAAPEVGAAPRDTMRAKPEFTAATKPYELNWNDAPAAKPSLDVLSPTLHDPTGPGLALLQKPTDAFKGLPLDRKGRVDWVKTLQQGAINPRADLHGQGAMTVLDLDVLMTETKSMPFVRFPHLPHTQWLACSNCHPTPFAAKAGSNPIDMNSIFRGQYCGMCHGRVAFSTYICERCHSVPHAGSPGQWWK